MDAENAISIAYFKIHLAQGELEKAREALTQKPIYDMRGWADSLYLLLAIAEHGADTILKYLRNGLTHIHFKYNAEEYYWLVFPLPNDRQFSMPLPIKEEFWIPDFSESGQSDLSKIYSKYFYRSGLYDMLLHPPTWLSKHKSRHKPS